MWFNEISDDSDVVISTRVRFARNISGYKFEHLLSKDEKEKIINEISKVIDKDKYTLLKSKDMDEVTLYSLVEKYLISKEFACNRNGAIVVNDDNSLVAMINEEDHLRIQSFEPGFNINKCYDRLCDFTQEVEDKIKFARNDKYGYLTACPTNVGAGMRVSIMLHLPALSAIGTLPKILEQVSGLGISVRGMYGENSSAYGNIYQISNQKTLGVTDEEIIDRVSIVVKTLINEERKARNRINTLELKDEIYRAYGILKNARILKEEECLKLLSKLRLGTAMNIIEEVKLEKIQRLLIDTHSNCLQLIYKNKFDRKEENIKRADYVREELK